MSSSRIEGLLPSSPIRLIGAAWGLGARDGRCAEGPEALKRLGLEYSLRQRGLNTSWQQMITADVPRDSDTVSNVAHACIKLAHATEDALRHAQLPVVLGGDHTCAIGTWGGVRRYLKGSGPLGLIWIDAHLDSHLPHTTPSNALHGMPAACLLGRGDARLTRLFGEAPTLRPEHLCLVGARSFEPAECALLVRLGVRVFAMDEVRRRGLDAVLAEALSIVQTQTAGFGVSIDLDALDPEDAPGVSTPAANGLLASELAGALAGLRSTGRLVGVEVVELNPALDVFDRTAITVIDVLGATLVPPSGAPCIEIEQRYAAPIYSPLPVVLARGQGVYLWDESGRRYIDMMSAYSAASFGHCHPRILRALAQQAQTLGVTSRAFYGARLALLVKRLCELSGQHQAIPANTGLEAVEVALKAARRWAYKVKGVPDGAAEIVACTGNFHGRSIAIIGMSSEPAYRDGFGPFPAGFKLIPFGDAAALAHAITPNTAAFLVEPIQGEAGIVVPPSGYLAECARICASRNVLLLCDEIQTGFGRTGKLFASQHEDVRPDGLILGKALGGGLLPVSMFLGRRDVMETFTPGSHGSTFAGNSLSAGVALEALDVLHEERLTERSAELGAHLLARLAAIRSPLIRSVRGRGLFAGVEFDPNLISARVVCERLMAQGVLSKETHDTVVRFAPPLVITRAQLDFALDLFERVVEDIQTGLRAAA